jgi:hypothetical protein
MAASQEFRVDFDGWVAGRRVRKGEIVRLTAAEARYEPIAPVVSATDPEPAARPKRRARQ